MSFTKGHAVIRKRNQLFFFYHYKKKMVEKMNRCTHPYQNMMTPLNKEIAILSFRSYTVNFSIPLKALFCQMEDGTEPLNELFAIDLPWGIIYQINPIILLTV